MGAKRVYRRAALAWEQLFPALVKHSEKKCVFVIFDLCHKFK